ncbi:MAG: DUF1289 domain-containing protein [Xanthobacteraceae bacterium]
MAVLESPCTKVCAIEPMSGLCLGCGRTLAEIEHWLVFTVNERDEVMAKLPLRLAGLRGRNTDRFG